METETAAGGQELMMSQIAKLMAQMEALTAENKSLKTAKTVKAVATSCAQNWEMTRKGDKLSIVIDLTKGNDLETKSGKSTIVSLVKKPVPFKFGTGGEVQCGCDWSDAWGNFTLQLNQGKPDAYLKVKEQI